MEENLVLESLKFMILGMGVVFSFLIIMIYALKVQAVLINKFFSIVEKKPIKNMSQVATSNTAKEIAAITAVIQHHNNNKG